MVPIERSSNNSKADANMTDNTVETIATLKQLVHKKYLGSEADIELSIKHGIKLVPNLLNDGSTPIHCVDDDGNTLGIVAAGGKLSDSMAG
jgi:hypothetical protein